MGTFGDVFIGVPLEWDSFRPDYVGVARSVANTKQGRLNTPTDAWCSLTCTVSRPIPPPDPVSMYLQCVVLPDPRRTESWSCPSSLNAPTGAWCSLTRSGRWLARGACPSQCTYRCVVLPDGEVSGLPEPAEGSQCTYRCVVLPDLTFDGRASKTRGSQCTYRCVVLPDGRLPTQ